MTIDSFLAANPTLRWIQTQHVRRIGGMFFDGSGFEGNKGRRGNETDIYIYMYIPWEPTTFIFTGYNPYIGGSKPSFFMVLGSKGMHIYVLHT